MYKKTKELVLMVNHIDTQQDDTELVLLSRQDSFVGFFLDEHDEMIVTDDPNEEFDFAMGFAIYWGIEQGEKYHA